jgi:hypothetical protein
MVNLADLAELVAGAVPVGLRWSQATGASYRELDERSGPFRSTCDVGVRPGARRHLSFNAR